MFNNPLKKYQQGGQVSQEEQQILAAFVDWLPKRVKEFQGMQPEQIVEALNGMSKSPEGQKQVQAYMQQFQKEMQTSKAGMFKDGGKLQDFICKHKNGAKIAVCGCNEDGGKVNKAQDGEKLEDSAPERYYNEKGVPSELNRYTTRPGRMLYAEVPTPKGNINFEFNQLNKAVPDGLNLPIEYDVQTRSMLDDSGSVGQQQLPLYQMPYFSQLKAQGAAYQEDGGVIKGADGLSRKDALAAAMEAYGFDKAQARRAYANAKYALRNSGLRGSALKQAAREMISKRNNAPAEQPLQMESIPMEGTIAAVRPVAFAIQSQGDPRPIKSVGISGAPTRNYDNMTFNNAFRAARNIAQNGGDQTFMWRGKSYGTNLANPRDMRTADIDAMNNQLFGNIPEGWMPPRDGSWRTAPVQTPYREKGGVVKGQGGIPEGMPEIPAENKIYSEQTTMVKGPSIGQRGLGVRRPWLAQTISFNPFSAQNDTTYTGRNLEAFIPGYSDDLLKTRYSALPPAVKKNLAKAIDSDYEEYNSTYGSYPNNYYEKTITVKKRK